jgi:spore maturation protein CgeB
VKVLVLEEGLGSNIYGGAFSKGFGSIGCNVDYEKWSIFNEDFFSNSLLSKFLNLYKKIENRFAFGFFIKRINENIKHLAEESKPDVVFIYRGIHIYPSTVRYLIEELGLTVLGYNNDDPFSDNYPNYYWRHYLNSLPYYSHVFSYRQKNINDYQAIGIDSTLLRSYYLKDKNFPIENISENCKYISDVSFIGHYEADGRDQLLLSLLKKGVDLKVYGPEWHRSPLYSQLVSLLGYEIESLKGTDYNLAINACKIALVFLSKLNHDTYTRRCFEIPATKTMMLAEYTDDLATLYTPGKEADFFSSEEDLLKKIEFYLKQNHYQNIGEAGYKRLLKDGHEVTDRCRQVIDYYKNMGAK